MKEKVLTFIKGNWLVVVLLLLLLTSGIFHGFREARIRKDAEKITALQVKNSLLQQDRKGLEADLAKLQADYKILQGTTDSLKTVLAASQKQLQDMKIKHQREIDSLMNIPADTVYYRLQPIYPNTDNSPLLYPFSGTQIKQIYHTAVSYPRLESEFTLQGQSLNKCTDLNKSYERSISNLDMQVEKLKDIVKNNDAQIGNYKDEIKIKDKQVRGNKFWRNVFGVTTLIGITTTTVLLVK